MEDIALHPAPTGRITQGSPSYSNREDATELSLLISQEGYSRALPPARTRRIQQGSPSCSNREEQ
jgi:hypothetical protein